MKGRAVGDPHKATVWAFIIGRFMMGEMRDRGERGR